MRNKLTFCGSRATNSADEKHTKPILNVVPSPTALGYDWVLYSASTQLYISVVPFYHATDSNSLKIQFKSVLVRAVNGGNVRLNWHVMQGKNITV